MELTAWTAVLVAIAPSIAAICTILGGIIGLFKALKANNERQKAELNEALSKLNKAYKDIANMKTQLASINQYLIDEKERQ